MIPTMPPISRTNATMSMIWPIAPMTPSPDGEMMRISPKPINARTATPDARIGAIQCFSDWNWIDSFAMRLSAMAMSRSSDALPRPERRGTLLGPSDRSSGGQPKAWGFGAAARCPAVGGRYWVRARPFDAREGALMPHGLGSAASARRGRLVVVFAITAVVFVLELVGGAVSNSLALLADAGHMATDLGAIGLALAAIWFAQRPASRDRTYGYLRLEILAAVVNAVVLFGIAAFVLFEAWQRLSEPPAIASGLMLIVALVGFAANAISLALLHDAQRESLTMRGAYLEVMGDLAGSVAVIVAAVVIATTGWTPADAVASAVIGLVVLPRTWRLLRDAVDVLLEATPKGIDLADVRAHILAATGVADVHDLHAWTITSGVDVLSAHVVLAPGADAPSVLDELCRGLSGRFDIEHSTFQLETADRRRLEEAHHA